MRHTLALMSLAAGLAAFAMPPVSGAAMPSVASTAPAYQGRGAASGVTTTTFQPPPSPPKTGTSTITGRVIDGESTKPIAGAVVQLGGDPDSAERPRQVTDRDGRFQFANLPAFDGYTVSAIHPAYLGGRYESSGESEALRIPLADAQPFDVGNIALHKPASITGRVTDELGDPVVGVPVRLVTNVPVAGAMHRVAGPSTETDDRGVYRVSGLRPGSYLVHVPNVQITLADGAVRPPVGPQAPLAMSRTADGFGVVLGHFATGVPPASGRGYPMAYHPAARSANEAQPIVLDYGDARANVDVQLALAPTVRVSGTLAGPASAIAGMPMWLVPDGDEYAGPGSEAATTLSTPGGAFTFLNVPAGAYTVVASRMQAEYSLLGSSRPLFPERGSVFNVSMLGGSFADGARVSYSRRGRDGVGAAGRLSVTVRDKDISGLSVPLTLGVTVSGHFLWDGEPEPPAGQRNAPWVSLEPANGDLSIGIPQSDFIPPSGPALPTPVPFTIPGVQPGQYIVAILQTGGAALEGATWRGRDLMSQPLDVRGDTDITDVVVRVTKKRITVSGTVRDSNGAPVMSGAVLFFPAAPADWSALGVSAPRFKTASIASGGLYENTHLIPGDYLVAAVSAADRAKGLDREFLTSIAGRATKLHVDQGATLIQDLRMPGGVR